MFCVQWRWTEKQCVNYVIDDFILSKVTKPEVLVKLLINHFGQLTYLISHIIHNDDAMGSTVVTGGDGTEPLLTCRVPLRKTRTQKQQQWIIK